MFLNWITQIVKAAVLRGFAEAAAELDLENADGTNPLAAITARMTPTDNAPAIEAADTKTRKSR